MSHRSLSATMTRPTTQVQPCSSIEQVPALSCEKSMTDGLSMVLIQWSELDRKLSEFREIITEEGNDMNVTASKKLLSDLQLEWEELDKKTNTILHYEWQYNGVLNISCPPVSLSNCI